MPVLLGPREIESLDDECPGDADGLAARDAAMKELGFRKTTAYVETEETRTSRRAQKESDRKKQLAAKGLRQLNLMTSGEDGWRDALGAIAKLSSDPDVLVAVMTLARDPGLARRLQGDTLTKPEGERDDARVPASLDPFRNRSEGEALRLGALLDRPDAMSLLSVAATFPDDGLRLVVEVMRSDAMPILLREAMSHDLGELISRFADLLHVENEAEARLNVRLLVAFLTYPNWRSVFAYLGRHTEARANLALVLHDETVATLLKSYRADDSLASAVRHLLSPTREGEKPEARQAAVDFVNALLSDPAITARLRQGEPVSRLLENLKHPVEPNAARKQIAQATVLSGAGSVRLLHRIGAAMRAASLVWSAPAGSRISITQTPSSPPPPRRRQSPTRASR